MENAQQTVDQKIINAQVLDVFNLKFTTTTVWLNAGKVYALGDQPSLVATTTTDAHGQYLVPGIIDAHMHVESSLLSPTEFGKLALSRGITTIFADPHEVANVQGTDGLRYMLADGAQSPITIQWMLPSSVPAVSFEHSGAILKAADLKPFYAEPSVGGLAEVMDFPAVKSADPDMLQKISDARAAGKQVDGHTAGLTPADLNVYRQYGIATDHESTTVAEARARVDAGFFVYLREGTVERDLANILGAVDEHNYTRFAFATDDKTANDVIREGGVDFNVKKAISLGLDPAMAYTMASLNAAQSHFINDLGAITPGYTADLLLVDDLQAVHVTKVMKAGEWTKPSTAQTLPWDYASMNYTIGDLHLPLQTGKAHVIGIRPGHIDTEHLQINVPMVDGEFAPSASEDLAKMVVVERHHNLGTTGVGILRGLGLREGAIATSISHDSHNLIAAGMSDELITKALDTIAATNGGLVVVDGAGNVTELPLSIAGLMSNEDYHHVVEQYNAVLAAFRQISAVEYDPFLTLSFLALPVIPSLKLTDQGLFDFDKFDFIDINA